MSSEWRRPCAEELISDGLLVIGDGYRAKICELSADGLPFARAGNVNGGFDFRTADRYPAGDLGRVGEKVSLAGDVVVTSKGTVGRFALVRETTPRFVYSPQLSFWRSLDHQRINPRFLFYCLQGRAVSTQIAGLSGQTDMADYISLADQRRLRIPLPPPPEQRAIAAILGAFDDKIEVNRRMCDTLEAMARALFKSWFVDFDPVRAKAAGRGTGLPRPLAELFPDSLGPGRGAVAALPTGWGVSDLGSVAHRPRTRAISPRDVDAATPFIGLEHMPRGRLVIESWGEAGSVTSGKLRFAPGEILFGKLRPYFRKLTVAPVAGVCSTDVVVVVPAGEDWFGLALGHLSSDAFISFVSSGAHGTRMPRTSWGVMASFPIALPPPALARCFDRIVRPMIAKMTSLGAESRTLGALRDALLPKLVSGEIRVKQAERIAQAVL